MRKFITLILLLNSILSFGQSDTIYFEKFPLKALGSFREGKEQGKWTYWFLNNQKQSEGYYDNGVLTGKWTNWHKNGRIYAEGGYQNGVKHGHWITMDSLGRKTREEEFEFGKRAGTSREWDYEKREFILGKWKNDKLNGLTEWRNIENDQLILTIEYVDGIRNGMLTFYYPNGKMKSRGVFKNDKEEGQHVWYNEDGTIYATANYNEGVVVK